MADARDSNQGWRAASWLSWFELFVLSLPVWLRSVQGKSVEALFLSFRVVDKWEQQEVGKGVREKQRIKEREREREREEVV